MERGGLCGRKLPLTTLAAECEVTATFRFTRSSGARLVLHHGLPKAPSHLSGQPSESTAGYGGAAPA